MQVYLFGWPGTLGGAATKFTHLLRLLRRRYVLTVVHPRASKLKRSYWTAWLAKHGIEYRTMADLATRLRGWGICLCDSDFLLSPDWRELRRRGLKMAWGNEMMWPLEGEAGAITMGQIDAVLYVSPAQREALEPEYQRILSGSVRTKPVVADNEKITGEIDGGTIGRNLKWVMVGNYIDPSAFPFRDRKTASADALVVGRLSRPEPSKFPLDFPLSYESLGLKNARFRVMGWGQALQECWPDHHFDHRWELLEPQENTVPFLQSLDLFVYDISPRFRESWGRVVVEAMLTGAVPLVPAGGRHHLENLVQHEASGFICRTRADYARFAQYLEQHPAVRFRMSRAARTFAVRHLCNVRDHLRRWGMVFHSG